MSHIPLVALVGRPNVGKSTLFNRLVGERRSLVHDLPGVTRDRIFGRAHFENRVFDVVDTGGIGEESEDPLKENVSEQSFNAAAEADLIFFVIDGKTGITPADEVLWERLRRLNKDVAVIANKLDVIAHDELVADVYRLGVADVVGVSAEHGRGFDGVWDVLNKFLDLPDEDAIKDRFVGLKLEDDLPDGQRIEWDGGPIRVAVVGRPNVGKSTLINQLLGEERLVASDLSGTTRDSVDVQLDHYGQPFVFVDTAGMRKRRNVIDKIEQLSVMMAERQINSADVVLLLLDGTQRPSVQDAKVAAMAKEKGKGVVILVNKWDLPENEEWKLKFEEAVRKDLKSVSHSPLVKISAKTGKNVQKIFEQIVLTQKERHRRVGTGELNRFFRAVVEHHPPPSSKGKRAKLFYVTQPMVRPPTFVFMTSRSESIPQAYTRYLENNLRERYGFDGTPIWIKYRGRGKKRQDMH